MLREPQQGQPLKPLAAPMFAEAPEYSDYVRAEMGPLAFELYKITYRAQTANYSDLVEEWAVRKYFDGKLVKTEFAGSKQHALAIVRHGSQNSDV